MDAKKKAILKKRALELAKEPEHPDKRGRAGVLEFMLAHERYAVESSYVREVYDLKDITPVPCTPPFVLGIINVRGQIISVLDLKKLLNLPGKGLGELNKAIILRSETIEFGVLADLILGVRDIHIRGLQRSVPTLAGVGQEYLKGVTADNLILLDAGGILADKRIIVNEEAGL